MNLMYKKYLLILLVCFFSFKSNSQEFAIGIKGGLNNNSIGDIISYGGSFQNGQPNEVFSATNDLGYHFGAFVNIEFGKLFIRPEINYVELNNSYKFPDKVSEWSTSKIEIPILLGYKIFKPVSIYVGPGFDFYNDVTLFGANNTDGVSSINYYKSTTTFNFGLNVEFKRFGIDLRYQMANKETIEERQDFDFSATGVNQADIYAYKPSQISLSLNIFLFRTNADDIGGAFANLFKNNKCYCPY